MSLSRYISIGLLLLGLAHFGRTVVVFSNHIIDFEYISTVLCINKDKPRSKCNGKCHLSKELKQSAPTQQEEPVAVLTQVDFLFYFFSSEKEMSMGKAVNTLHNFDYRVQKTLEFFKEIPVPPPSFV